MPKTWEEQLIDIASMIEPREVQLDPSTIPVTAEILEDIHSKYGPESDEPRAHHNAPHGVDVARRNVRMLNILYPYLKDHHRPKAFDLAFLIGAGHDFEQNMKKLGANERASANNIVRRVSALDSKLNTNKLMKRLSLGIQATTVIIKSDGEVIQPNLQKGSHDPIKLVAAYGDINGIAMEGGKRMFRDASNLCEEQRGNPTPEERYDFFLTQAAFLKQRLNDHQVKSDIAYYFPDNTEEVYSDMRKVFRGNIMSAYGMARLLNDRPELKKSVEHIVMHAGSRPAKAIGNALLRRLTSGG